MLMVHASQLREAVWVCMYVCKVRSMDAWWVVLQWMERSRRDATRRDASGRRRIYNKPIIKEKDKVSFFLFVCWFARLCLALFRFACVFGWECFASLVSHRIVSVRFIRVIPSYLFCTSILRTLMVYMPAVFRQTAVHPSNLSICVCVSVCLSTGSFLSCFFFAFFLPVSLIVRLFMASPLSISNALFPFPFQWPNITPSKEGENQISPYLPHAGLLSQPNTTVFFF